MQLKTPRASPRGEKVGEYEISALQCHPRFRKLNSRTRIVTGPTYLKSRSFSLAPSRFIVYSSFTARTEQTELHLTRPKGHLEKNPAISRESAMPIDVLVTISPKPGKEKRVGEILTSVTESVKVTEPDTLNYHSYSTNGDEEGTVDYVVHIRYEDIVVVISAKQLSMSWDLGLTCLGVGLRTKKL